MLKYTNNSSTLVHMAQWFLRVTDHVNIYNEKKINYPSRKSAQVASICIHLRHFQSPKFYHPWTSHKEDGMGCGLLENLREDEDQLWIILLGLMWSGHMYPPSAFHFNCLTWILLHRWPPALWSSPPFFWNIWWMCPVITMQAFSGQCLFLMWGGGREALLIYVSHAL